ncbi:hypothetical protein GN956_G12934 [Arapaima gigas]
MTNVTRLEWPCIPTRLANRRGRGHTGTVCLRKPGIVLQRGAMRFLLYLPYLDLPFRLVLNTPQEASLSLPFTSPPPR